MKDNFLREELSRLLLVSIDEITDEKALDQFDNWDSLTQVSLIAAIIDKSGTSMEVDELDTVSTVGELRQLVERQLPGVSDEARL